MHAVLLTPIAASVAATDPVAGALPWPHVQLEICRPAKPVLQAAVHTASHEDDVCTWQAGAGAYVECFCIHLA
jgi:hypothetical protein